ncbi:MAG TPA: DMT family transporter [bacterium]|nr:DMT family transporter [bacterium]HPG45555.1 DMT family transporter [bacterium]HPM97666.1 DMT family transporter [bacterium]
MPYLGELSALAAAFLWSGTVVLLEETGRRIGALVNNTARLLMGLALLCLTLWLQKGTLLPLHADQDQMIWLGLSGIVGLAIGDGALMIALLIIGSRRSTLLLSLAPPITTVLAWILLNESLPWLAVGGIAITIGGIFWVVTESNAAEPIRGSRTKGILLGIAAAVGQALGTILVRFGFRSEIDALSATILRMIPAVVVMLLVVILQGKIRDLWQVLKRRRLLIAMIVASIGGPFLGVWLSIVAVKYTEAGIASTLLATVPVMVIPVIFFAYRIRPSWRAIIGTIITMVGIAMIFLR